MASSSMYRRTRVKLLGVALYYIIDRSRDPNTCREFLSASTELLAVMAMCRRKYTG